MKKIIFISIITLAAGLRFWNISYFPAGLNADEAALGYNAYSLLQTGKDEHGHFMPVNLESFGDYKPALYSYLLVPVIKLFGLTEFAIRFPSAIFGVLAVFLVYVLTKLLFDNSIKEIAALFLAISPWHLHFSRGAWEVNIATSFILLGLVFFLRWVNGHKFIYFASSVLVFSFSMYTYQSARVLAPLLGLGLIVIYRKTIFAYLNHSVWAALFLLLALTPLILSLLSTPAASRAAGVGLLADEGPLNFVNELRGQYSGPTAVLGRFLHNRPVIYSIQFVKNYLSHFDGNFLFINGDEIQRNRIPETGLLFFTDFVLLAFGFLYLATSYKLQAHNLILMWLFVAPFASALTFQVPHALRAQNMIIPLTILSAAGLSLLFSHLNLKNWKLLGICCLVFGAYSWQVSRYLHQYYVHYPQTYPAAWEYGFKELVSYVIANQSRYEKVLITDKYDQPYILFLFYSRYNPRLFQDHHQLSLRDKYNFSTVREFDKYIFTDTAWDKVRDNHGSLIAAAGNDIPPVGVNVVKTVNFPNNQPAFKIVSN